MNQIDVEHLRKMKEESLRKFWMELKPFVKSEDVPQLPIPLTDFHINKLIELGAIAKDKLEDGVWYYGEYRNSEFGKWDAANNEFGLWRYKFGYRWDECNHFQDDNGFALFVPLRKASEEELEKIKKIENEATGNNK